MKRAHHITYGIQMLTAVRWCRDNGIPVLIRFARPLAIPPQETETDYIPEMMTVTGRSVIRKLNGRSFPPGVTRRGMVIIVRDRDYELVRLRF